MRWWVARGKLRELEEEVAVVVKEGGEAKQKLLQPAKAEKKIITTNNIVTPGRKPMEKLHHIPANMLQSWNM